MQRLKPRGMDIPHNDVVALLTVESERIYDGHIISVRIDRVMSPSSGGPYRREVIEHPGAAVIIAQPDVDHLVLVRQWRHAAGLRMWEIPAGMLDPGEAPEIAAARELREETGYTAEQITPLFTGYSAPGFSAELLHFYHATGLTAGASDPDEGEELLVQTFSLDELQSAVACGELPDTKTQLAVMWALLERIKVSV